MFRLLGCPFPTALKALVFQTIAAIAEVREREEREREQRESACVIILSVFSLL